MREITITDIPGIMIGQVESHRAATGATVILCPEGMAASIDVRGGGPASRDSRILDPLAAAESIHAILLAGGSAFGLDAAGGVQKYLEENDFGHDMGIAKVPLVCQSNIFDLGIGDSAVRPDAAMGYAACVEAETGNYQDGNYGAGCGATVGKVLGPEFCMKSGIGSYAVQLGPLQVGAIVVVNALGDVFDPSTGKEVAGLLSEDKLSLRSSAEVVYGLYEMQADDSSSPLQDSKPDLPMGVTNTTIGAVITNAKLSKAQLCKMAGMAHDGIARAICPVHTSMDGDSVYSVSVGDVPASLDLVGSLAADVMSHAILKAVYSAKPAYGLLSAQSFAD